MPFKHIKTKHRNISHLQKFNNSKAPIKLQTSVARHLRISATPPLESPVNQQFHWGPQRGLPPGCVFLPKKMGSTSKLMVPPAISEQRLLGRGSFSFKACSHAGDSDGSKRGCWQGIDKIEKFNLLKELFTRWKYKSTPIYQHVWTKDQICLFNSCVCLRHLYYQKSITHSSCLFLPFITQLEISRLTSQWPSWVAWSSNHWKDLVLFSSLEIPKGPVSS